MPTYKEKNLIISNFHGGMSDVDSDVSAGVGECAFVQQADLFDNKEFLAPSLAMTADDGSISGVTIPAILGYETIAVSSVNTPHAVFWDYAAGAYKLNVATKSSLTSIWTSQDTHALTGTETEPPFGMWKYGTYLYFFAKPMVIDRYLPGTGIDENWDTLNTAAWGTTGTIGGTLVHTDGSMYFYKGQYIGPWDGTTKPSLITPVDLEPNYSIVDAVSHGNQIIIAANDVTNSTTSKLFLYDPYSSTGLYTFDDIYDTHTFNIQAIRMVEGTLKVITALGDYRILDWRGGNVFLPNRKVKVGSTTQFYARRSTFDVKDNIMYFGTNNSVSGFSNGIYAYGRSTPNDNQILHSAHINDASDVSSIDYRALKWITVGGESNLFAGYYDGANYQLARIGTNYSDNLQYDSIWFRPFRGLKSQCIKATSFFEPLPASCTITLNMAKDGGAFPGTVIGTASGTGEVLKEITNATATTAFQKGYRHKIRITMNSDAATRPQLEAIKLRFRTTSAD